MIIACRQSAFGSDAKAEGRCIETKGMIQTDNVYPIRPIFSTRRYTCFEFSMSRYNEAFAAETIALCNSRLSLIHTAVPPTGQDESSDHAATSFAGQIELSLQFNKELGTRNVARIPGFDGFGEFGLDGRFPQRTGFCYTGKGFDLLSV
jgi:hypothetical protein